MEDLRAAKALGELTDFELVHLVLQRAQGNPEIFGGAGDVPAAFLERAEDEIPLERVGGLDEEAVRAGALRFELVEVKLQRQIFVGDEVLVADGDEPLD